MNKKLLKEYLTEAFLILEDSRGNILKLGFSKEFADHLHSLYPKHSFWLAHAFKINIQISHKSIYKDIIGNYEKEIELWDRWVFFNEIEELMSFAIKKNFPIKNFSLKDLKKKYKEFKEIEMSESKGTVKMEFSDGFYWIDLGSGSCSYEGREMGHCGMDGAGNLWSLRDKNKKPHVTITVSGQDIVQAKGKQNTVPQKKYNKYIAKLIAKYNLNLITKGNDNLTIYNFDYGPLQWIYKQTGNEIYNIPKIEVQFKNSQNILKPKIFKSLQKIKKMVDSLSNVEYLIVDNIKYSSSEIFDVLSSVDQDLRLDLAAFNNVYSFKDRFQSEDNAKEHVENTVNSVERFFSKVKHQIFKNPEDMDNAYSN